MYFKYYFIIFFLIMSFMTAKESIFYNQSRDLNIQVFGM